MNINLDSGVAYNSTIELVKFNTLSDIASIAVALKSNKVHIILIDPFEKKHKVYLTFETSCKATSMIELNNFLIGIAVGNWGEKCNIEIWSYIYGVKAYVIPAHSDLIDSIV